MISVSFRIYYTCQYGSSLYLCGGIPLLGNWDMQRALRLSWNKDHQWTCTIDMPVNTPQFDFKYFVSRSDQPNQSEIKWENGPNRSINLANYANARLEINDVWEFKKVTLRLFQSKRCLNPQDSKPQSDPTAILSSSTLACEQNEFVYTSSESTTASDEQISPISVKERFYVTADTDTLGNLQSLQKMRKRSYISVSYEQASPILGGSGDAVTASPTKTSHRLEYEIIYWEKSFLVKSSTQNLRYRYAYKSETHENDYVERKVRRINFSKNDIDAHATYAITDTCCTNQFNFDPITQNIFLGPYPENQNQIASLAKQGIKAIFNLQTIDDMKIHCINTDLVKLACATHDIKQIHLPVNDMDAHDMAIKLPLLVQKLSNAIRKYQCVYVHCTSGIFRSAQLVIAYLHLFLQFDLNSAITFVESKRPITKKNRDYLQEVYAVRGGYSTSLKPQSAESSTCSSISKSRLLIQRHQLKVSQFHQEASTSLFQQPSSSSSTQPSSSYPPSQFTEFLWLQYNLFDYHVIHQRQRHHQKNHHYHHHQHHHHHHKWYWTEPKLSHILDKTTPAFTFSRSEKQINYAFSSETLPNQISA